jgi:two-component system OmpR family sensor kinase
MNKESIFFKLNAIFIVTILSLVSVFVGIVIYFNINKDKEFIVKSLKVNKLIYIVASQTNSDKNAINSIITNNNFKIVEIDQNIIQKGELVGISKKEKNMLDNLHQLPPSPHFEDDHRYELRPPKNSKDHMMDPRMDPRGGHEYRREPQHFGPPPFGPPPPQFGPHGKDDDHIRPDVKIVEYNNQRYLYMKNDLVEYMLMSTDHSNKNTLSFIIMLGLIVIAIVFSAYYMLRKNLMLLKTVHKGILSYGDGVIDDSLRSIKKDEISQVSNEFYNTITKIDKLQESRKFLLRNMMHELKTPLTKSKLYLGFLDDGDIKDKLENSLNKLELLINEMANIEKISSSNVLLGLKEYRVGDIIDDAKDALFIDKDIVDVSLESNNPINVDFKLFSIVIKNLIDNGIKYSEDGRVKVVYTDDKISVISNGEKLPHSFDKYLEPFFKGKLNSTNQKGFGLGLYIVNEIVTKHDFVFDYNHIDGKNSFEIKI